MKWHMHFDFAGNSYFSVEKNEAVASQFFTSESTEFFEVKINGFMISDQPSIDINRNSWSMQAFKARIDTGSYTTFIPKNYFDIVMNELMDWSIGFFWDD